MSDDQFSWWRYALKGEFGELTVGVPESGFYRHLRRDGTYVPIAIWRENGEPIAKVGERLEAPDAEWCERFFATCSKRPITHAAYEGAMRGEPWPDSAPVKAASNMPSDPFDAIRIDLEAEQEIVEELLRAPITDDVTAGKAASLADRIGQTGKRADGLRVEEKKPHDDAAKAVQAKWKPVIGVAEDLVARLKSAIGRHLIAKRRVAEEAERLRLAAEQEARRKAEAEAAANNQPPPPPESAEIVRPVAVRTSVAGAEGRTVALRKQRVAVIVDYDRVFAALKNNSEVRALLQTLCDRAARANMPVDGMEIRIEEKAA